MAKPAHFTEARKPMETIGKAYRQDRPSIVYSELGIYLGFNPLMELETSGSNYPSIAPTPGDQA